MHDGDRAEIVVSFGRRVLVCSTAASLIACSTGDCRTDGLNPDQWSKREEARARPQLAVLREAVRRRVDDVVAAANVHRPFALLRGEISEKFALGGNFNMGGPSYCREGDVNERPSSFLVYATVAWVEQRELHMTTIDGATDRVQVGADASKAISVSENIIRGRDIGEVKVLDGEGEKHLSILSTRENLIRMIRVAMGDSAAAEALVSQVQGLRSSPR